MNSIRFSERTIDKGSIDQVIVTLQIRLNPDETIDSWFDWVECSRWVAKPIDGLLSVGPDEKEFAINMAKSEILHRLRDDFTHLWDETYKPKKEGMK